MKNLFQRRAYRGLLFLTLMGLISTPLANAQSENAQTDSKLIGDWLGAIDTEFGALRVIFHVRESADGLAVTLDSPDQGSKGIPAAVVSSDSAAIKFTVSVANAIYEGSLSSDGKSIDGTWSQQGANESLTLTLQDGLAELPIARISNLSDALTNKLIGAWNGELNVPGMTLGMTYTISRDGDGSVIGRLAVPAQGISDLPFTLEETEDSISLKINSLGAEFLANLSDDEDALDGVFKQSGQQFDLSLKRQD